MRIVESASEGEVKERGQGPRQERASKEARPTIRNRVGKNRTKCEKCKIKVSKR